MFWKQSWVLIDRSCGLQVGVTSLDAAFPAPLIAIIFFTMKSIAEAFQIMVRIEWGCRMMYYGLIFQSYKLGYYINQCNSTNRGILYMVISNLVNKKSQYRVKY